MAMPKPAKITLRLLAGLSAFALLLFAASCNPLPQGGVPIYVHIDSPKVSANSYFGSSSSRIPSVWATTGAHNLGAYETPVNIPVLAEGNVSLAVSGGIFNNGIISAPKQYPFYAADTFTISNAIPGHVYIHHPVYTYLSYTQVGLNCDFENLNYFTNIAYIVKPTPDPDSAVYEGYKGGVIVVDSLQDSVNAYLTAPLAINTNGRDAYVELNWKINNPNVLCDVGIIATQFSGTTQTGQTMYPKIAFQALGHWEKTYLDFTTEFGDNQGGNTVFQIYFTAYHSGGQQDTVFLDNIKLLYFH